MHKIEYPKFIFHTDGSQQVVDTAEQHIAAGDGWYESPGEAAEATEGASKPKKDPKPPKDPK